MHFRMILMTNSGKFEDVTEFIYPPPRIQQAEGPRFPSTNAVYLHCHEIAEQSQSTEWELWRVEMLVTDKTRVRDACSILVQAGLLTGDGWTKRDEDRPIKREAWIQG